MRQSVACGNRIVTNPCSARASSTTRRVHAQSTHCNDAGVYDQLHRALSAEGIDGALEHILLSLRIHNDFAYLTVRQAPSEAEARQWMDTEGKRSREPVAIARVAGNDAPVQLPPPNVIESSESVAGIGDGANIWRGYGRNTRGIIKFRLGCFIGEVNPPSVEDATIVAKDLVSLLRP